MLGVYCRDEATKFGQSAYSFPLLCPAVSSTSSAQFDATASSETEMGGVLSPATRLWRRTCCTQNASEIKCRFSSKAVDGRVSTNHDMTHSSKRNVRFPLLCFVQQQLNSSNHFHQRVCHRCIEQSVAHFQQHVQNFVPRPLGMQSL